MADDPLAALAPFLHKILNAAEAGLTESPPKRVILMPGDPVWDQRDQLWVRLVSITPYYPQSRVRSAPGLACGVAAWDLTFALGIIRCVGTVDSRGLAPKAGVMTRDAENMLGDAGALGKVLTKAEEVSEIVVWNPLSPQGGLAGGEWTARARVGII